MPADNYVRGKDKNELLHDLYGTAQPGSVVHEQLKMGDHAANASVWAAYHPK